MVLIYILKLENSKYYIGKTTNIDSRLSAHMLGNGSEWTKLHKLIKIDNMGRYDFSMKALMEKPSNQNSKKV